MKYYLCSGSYWAVLSSEYRVTIGYEHTPQLYRNRERARAACQRLKEIGVKCRVSRVEVTITDK
jgi:hypothetical protein